MRCDQLENELGCYIDGELASPEHREVENHLGECPACRGLVEEQQQVKRLLRKSLRDPQAAMTPPGLLAKVRQTLDASDGRGGWRWRLAAARPFLRTSLGVMVPVAAALALVVGYVENVEPIINDSIVKHQRNLPLEVTGEPAKVQSWFDGKVPFAVATPTLGPRCSLRGGRLSHLGNREAALLQYDQNGHKVSVFVFDGQKMPSPLRLRAPVRRIIGNREVIIEGTSGYHVAVFRNQGLGYAITTGPVAEAEFIQMVSAAVGQFSP
jgi:anti-sigma factor RsiW